jgi:uncharacterized Tic20 family protein
MTIADEIERLHQLKAAGAITDEEFAQAKQRVLSDALPPTPGRRPAAAKSLDERTREWAMFLHLSQLLGFVLPFGGLIAPLLIWQVKKTELPDLDAHGRVVLNWALSALIYFVVAAVLALVLIGIPLLLVLAVLAVVFPIIGGIRANEGELWEYPLSIPFFETP